MRRAATAAATAIAVTLAIALAGCSSSSSDHCAPPQTTVAIAPTPSTKATTTTTETQKPSGQTIVDAIKGQSMDGDPMMLPLVDAQWKAGFLVLTYQADDPDLASSLCTFVRNGPPPPLTLDDVKKVQVVGPDGSELAISNASGPGCKAK